MKRWIFLLIAGVNSTSVAQAAKLADFEARRNAARQEEANARAALPPIQARIDELRITLKAKEQEKRTLAQNYKDHLTQQGLSRVDEVQAILRDLQIVAAKLQKANQAYLDHQKRLARKYSDFIVEFSAYQNTEADRRESLQRNLTQVQFSRNVLELAPSRRKIHELYLNEIDDQNKLVIANHRLAREIQEAYYDYEVSIRSFQKGMERFELQKLSSPEITLRTTFERLEQMATYATQRREYFSRLIRAKFPDVEEKIRQIVAREVKKDVDFFAKLKTHGELNSAWHATVTQLFKQKDKIIDSEHNRVPVGCQQKLRELYDFYLEVLSHRKRCGNLEELKRQDSPYETGCFILKDLIKEAEAFFSTTAWKQMNLSIFSAKWHAPIHLKESISKLGSFKVHSGKGLEEPTLLLKAIKYHDQFLEDWKNWKIEASIQNPMEPNSQPKVQMEGLKEQQP